MDIIIEKMPAYRIAYIRQIGPYGINNVKIMEKLKKWAIFYHLFNDESVILGIFRIILKLLNLKAIVMMLVLLFQRIIH